jgi:sugar lactone lactonase YvrE
MPALQWTLIGFVGATAASLSAAHDFGKGRGIDDKRTDAKGNIYGMAGQGEAGGLYVFSRDGKQRAFVPMPETPTNCAFGGKDRKALCVTAGKSLYRISVNNEGFATFGQKEE